MGMKLSSSDNALLMAMLRSIKKKRASTNSRASGIISGPPEARISQRCTFLGAATMSAARVTVSVTCNNQPNIGDDV